MPKTWLTHPTSNTNVRAVAMALEEFRLLDRFHSCITIGQDIRNPLLRKLYKQRQCAIPEKRIRRHPIRETLRLLAQKIAFFQPLLKHETGPLCIDQIYRHLDLDVARALCKDACSADAIYAYEDGALEVFRAASKLGVRRLYDLPIGYWRFARRLQTEEAELKPEWAMTMAALKDSEAKLARKDEELRLAEAIYVASSFTAKTLEEVPFEIPKPVVIPYGCPSSIISPDKLPAPAEKLRVLYVGSLGQRKGLSYLLDAIDALGDSVELTIVGRRVADCAPLDAALEHHNWIESLPHSRILETMRQHDVFVFPSLFEGFGLVLTEALSQGLPIIATAHTCAPDIIEDGKEGFIVPIRDAESIATKLQFMNGNPEGLREMKEAAIQASQRITWQRYRNGLASAVKGFLETTRS
ncbi:MAG: glycosyltransferase family 4 protein [Verrucomicrobiota bacterium]